MSIITFGSDTNFTQAGGNRPEVLAAMMQILNEGPEQTASRQQVRGSSVEFSGIGGSLEARNAGLQELAGPAPAQEVERNNFFDKILAEGPRTQAPVTPELGELTASFQQAVLAGRANGKGGMSI